MSVAAEYYTESAEGREGSSAEGAITAGGFSTNRKVGMPLLHTVYFFLF